jgi:hypothetical protein
MPCPGIQDAACEVCGIAVAAVFIARTGQRRHGHHQPDEPPRRVKRVVRQGRPGTVTTSSEDRDGPAILASRLFRFPDVFSINRKVGSPASFS